MYINILKTLIKRTLWYDICLGCGLSLQCGALKIILNANKFGSRRNKHFEFQNKTFLNFKIFFKDVKYTCDLMTLCQLTLNHILYFVYIKNKYKLTCIYLDQSIHFKFLYYYMLSTKILMDLKVDQRTISIFVYLGQPPGKRTPVSHSQQRYKPWSRTNESQPLDRPVQW